jgi:hypothetical protein
MITVGQNLIFASAAMLTVRPQLHLDTTDHPQKTGQHPPERQNKAIAPVRLQSLIDPGFNWTDPSCSAKISSGYNPQ